MEEQNLNLLELHFYASSSDEASAPLMKTRSYHHRSAVRIIYMYLSYTSTSMILIPPLHRIRILPFYTQNKNISFEN
jgi:hypothetical protein